MPYSTLAWACSSGKVCNSLHTRYLCTVGFFRHHTKTILRNTDKSERHFLILPSDIKNIFLELESSGDSVKISVLDESLYKNTEETQKVLAIKTYRMVNYKINPDKNERKVPMKRRMISAIVAELV